MPERDDNKKKKLTERWRGRERERQRERARESVRCVYCKVKQPSAKNSAGRIERSAVIYSQ